MSRCKKVSGDTVTLEIAEIDHPEVDTPDSDPNDKVYRTMYTREHEEALDSIFAREQQITTYQKEVKPYKKFIQEYIGDMDGMITGKYHVNYTKEEPNTFDSASFKKDHPALYAKYTKTGSRRKLLISRKA